MKKFSLSVVVASVICFFFVPSFASVPIPSGLTDCNCACDDDLDSCACSGDCICIIDFAPAIPTASCTSQGTKNSVEQCQQLVYDDIRVNQLSIALTGLIAAVEGTYPDYEAIYLLDGEHALTNDVVITPGWCK